MDTLTIIVSIFSAAILCVSTWLINKSSKLNYETKKMIDGFEHYKLTMSVKGWKYALSKFEAAENFEICEKIKSHIEGKSDDETIEAPEGLYLSANPYDGVKIEIL